MILFVVDSTVGALDEDEAAVRMLRRTKKPVILVANKVDNDRQELESRRLWSLGLGQPYAVSALHGRGSGDLLDALLAALPDTAAGARSRARAAPAGSRSWASPTWASPRCSTGWPTRSGRSSTPWRGPQWTRSTAWSRSAARPGCWSTPPACAARSARPAGTEYYASLRTAGAIEAAEVAVVLLDAAEVISEQDQRVLTMVTEAGRALVIAFNKWDLVDEDRRYLLDKEIDRELLRIPWAIRFNISAKTGRAVDKLAPALHRALTSWDQRVPTGQLNQFITLDRRRPPRTRYAVAGRRGCCSPPRPAPDRRVSCCSPPASWTSRTCGSSNASCATSSASRATPLSMSVRPRKKK